MTNGKRKRKSWRSLNDNNRSKRWVPRDPDPPQPRRRGNPEVVVYGGVRIKKPIHDVIIAIMDLTAGDAPIYIEQIARAANVHRHTVQKVIRMQISAGVLVRVSPRGYRGNACVFYRRKIL